MPAIAGGGSWRGPAYGNLHYASPSAELADISEADMLAREARVETQ
jgi:hypothetical protein